MNALHKLEDLLVRLIKLARPYVAQGAAAAGRGLDRVGAATRPLREAVAGKVKPVARKVAATLGPWLAAAARWTVRMCVIGARKARPWIIRAVDRARPVVLRWWERARPYLEKAWVWSAPWRLKIVQLTKFLLNKVLQFGALSDGEKLVMAEAVGDEQVHRLLKTGAKVDVGMWFRSGRVWTCELSHDLVLFAYGKISWADRISYDELRESRYNHVTGELVLSPREGRPVEKLRVFPLEGLGVLNRVYAFARPGTHTRSWNE